MKKVALSLATVLAAAAFAPEASAIPSFARQTGMACYACHAQHVPVLNGFGRAFKASGYVMMGAQDKIEGEHLSIPSVLNASLLLKYRYVKDSGNGVVATAGAGVTAATAPADGQWQMGDEVSLFFGGRIAETELFTIGFINENNIANAPGLGNIVAGLRVPITVDLGAAKVSVVPFTTDALGVQAGFELSSGGVYRPNRWSEMRREVSAVQYNADRGSDGGSAAGTAFVVHNDMGFINFTKWSSSFAPGANGQNVSSTNYGQSYIRIAATPTIGDFTTVIGFGKMSGTSFGNLAGAQIESNQTFIDAQVQGNVAGFESGFYLQNASAPACTTAAAANCAYNTGAQDRKATTLGADVSVIPHTLSLQLALRKVSNNGNGFSDDATTLGAIYNLAQNVDLHANYSMYKGTQYDTVGRATSRFLGMLEAAW